MTITLFVPCFMNTLYPQAGMSIVTVLERLGHTVDFHEDLFCCGQPAFNAGYWDEARRSPARRRKTRRRPRRCHRHRLRLLRRHAQGFLPRPVRQYPPCRRCQSPSASGPGNFPIFSSQNWASPTSARDFPAKVTFHDGCHGLRELKVKQQPRRLLEHVQGLELIEMRDSETCCGFGGTFSAKFPAISTAMGEVKCAAAAETDAQYIVSNDSSCLMQIQGLLDRQRKPIQTLHLAEVLARQ